MLGSRVLIVDDQPDMREIARIGMQLTGGWEVLTASSGEAGLLMAAAEQPQVILLDMMMPGMDGQSTLRELRANPVTADIPVILLTADDHAWSELRVSGTIAKPFNPLKLAAEVKRILEGTR